MNSRSKFADQVGANIEQDKSRKGGFSYLSLPRGVELFKVEGGDRIEVDFLPYVITDEKHPDRNDKKDIALPGYEWYRRPYSKHGNVGVDNISVVCPGSIGKKCPICEYRSKLVKQGKQYDDDEVKALRPSNRNLYVVVPIGHKEYDEDIHIFDFSYACFEKKLLAELEEKPEFRPFFDPSEDGFTMSVRFSKEKFGKNDYADADRIDFVARKEGYTDKFLADVPNLDKVLIIHPYEKLHDLFFEIDDDDKEKEQEPETRHSSRSRRDEPEKDDKDDKEERTSRHSTRDDKEEEPEKEERTSRRGRDRDDKDKEPEKEERASRRGRDDDDKKEEKSVCVACEGSGEDSKGRTCPTCKGTGKGKDKGKDDKEEKSSRRSEKKTDPENECPHGYEFGSPEHCEKHPECDTCKDWEKCYDKKKALKKAAAR